MNDDDGNSNKVKPAAPKKYSDGKGKKQLKVKPKTKLEGIQCNLMASNAKEILNYFFEKYYEQLIPIIFSEDLSIYYDITIDLLDFFYNYPFFGQKFYEYPEQFLQFLKQTLIECQQQILEKDGHQFPQNSTMKKNLDVKLINVPPTKEIVAESIRQVTSEHLNKFITLFGTVVRTGHVNSRELYKDFQCKQCNKVYTCESDISEFNRFALPVNCNGKVEKKVNPFFQIANNVMNKIKNQRYHQNKDGDLGEQQDQHKKDLNRDFKQATCRGKAFVPVDNGATDFADYQEIKLQELFKTLKPGLIPRSMCIILQNTLVEMCKPGDDVMITGILIQRWKNMPPTPQTRPYIELALVANNVEVLNKKEFQKNNQISMESVNDFKRFWKRNDPIIGKKILISSVCPNLYQKYEVKLGVLLSLIGGVAQFKEEHSFKIRGQIHMLMVGEPGTGKSQLLQQATALSQRSVLTTGIGTTSAGLTVACFKDGSEFILEAGALVLADCGVCCIDEFSLIKPEDRASIHEAMEQQTLSIAKGGIVCKINTRATILAATNPGRTQKWDPNYDMQTNTGITSSLLSRFDLIFIMLDEHNIEDDLQKAVFTLNRSCIKYQVDPIAQQLWSTDKLRDYINFVQKVFEPVVTEDAETIVQSYYQYLRMNPCVNKDRKTVRMLESLIRMTEAHARLLMKSQATVFDAVSIIILMEHTLMTDLFRNEYLPSVIFESTAEYKSVRDSLIYKLGLDSQTFGRNDEPYELKKRCQTPSPIRRLEDSLFVNNIQSLDLSMAPSEMSFIASQDEFASIMKANTFPSQMSSKSQSISKFGSISNIARKQVSLNAGSQQSSSLILNKIKNQYQQSHQSFQEIIKEEKSSELLLEDLDDGYLDDLLSELTPMLKKEDDIILTPEAYEEDEKQIEEEVSLTINFNRKIKESPIMYKEEEETFNQQNEEDNNQLLVVNHSKTSKASDSKAPPLSQLISKFNFGPSQPLQFPQSLCNFGEDQQQQEQQQESMSTLNRGGGALTANNDDKVNDLDFIDEDPLFD